MKWHSIRLSYSLHRKQRSFGVGIFTLSQRRERIFRVDIQFYELFFGTAKTELQSLDNTGTFRDARTIFVRRGTFDRT